MTDNEIRIAIAEVLGIKQAAAVLKDQQERELAAYYQDRAKPTGKIPDYPKDLNACAEFEASLTDRRTYKTFLYIIVLEDPKNPDNDTTFATAPQRCEAFLRILNLWKE